MFSRLAMVFLLTVGLVGCQTTQGEGTKQRVGTILGGVAGAVTGSQFGKGSGRVAAGWSFVGCIFRQPDRIVIRSSR